MLEIKEEGNELILTLNGEKVEGATLHERVHNGLKWLGLLVTETAIRKIAICRFSEVPIEIEQVVVRTRLKLDNLDFAAIERIDSTNEFILRFTRTFDLSIWKEPFSFNEYSQEFKRLAESIFNDFQLNSDGHLILATTLYSPQLTILEEFEKCAAAINQLFKEAKDSLLSKLRANSVLTYFDLPDQVKVPAEQYLLYFIEFLRDLGVEATAEITHEAGQVLFAVTPADKGTALDKIRVALEVYMRLPSSPIGGDGSANDDIAIQKLEGNIYHLKSQLKYAHAEALAHKREIQAQQTIINYQQHFIDGLIILESAKAVREIEDKEDLLPGVLAVTKYKGNGFEISLAEIMRLLRKFLLE